ncbi:MAG: DUF177 domain-containing protein [Bacteroidetes bacterium]|nr:DUF177 domain-containing protein [Bacteroidota bacterium]MCO4775167.1 DUF177 domain-containing protein [Flavobacteriales bacterium]MDA8577007.1 DUF177 domain-containing protein [Schleiferiaceae bacterium]MBT7660280.1 DUF177 domain-containing protein [Bacteroidota bacterium]MCH9773788.1 DUF177 domain-containing protein [Bacteroidota bacterium]
MKKRDFDIAFRGLALGPHEFQYDLDDTFFTLFEYSDYQGLIGKAELMMLKSETVLDLEWRFTGNIEAPCDVTNEVYTQALTNSFAMQIKFGDEYNDENEELLILPHGDYKFNVGQMIYELVVLSIPSKLLGPNAGSGLEDFIEEEEDEKEEKTDPRWDQLKNLLNK